MAQDLERNAVQWYQTAWVCGWGLTFFVIYLVVYHLFLVRTEHLLDGAWWPYLALGIVMAVGLAPGYRRYRRAGVRRWQGLEGPVRGTNLGLVRYQVLVLVVVAAAAIWQAKLSRGQECAGTSGMAAFSLDAPIGHPADYQALPLGATGSGHLTIDSAASPFANPAAERRILRCDGFQVGYLKSWAASNPNRTLTLQLYEFSGRNGAYTFAQDDEQAIAHAGGSVEHVFGDDTVVIPTTPDREGNDLGWDFLAVGRVAVVIRMSRSLAPVSPADLHAFMVQLEPEVASCSSSFRPCDTTPGYGPGSPS